MKMNFLRSTISDARPRKSLSKAPKKTLNRSIVGNASYDKGIGSYGSESDSTSNINNTNASSSLTQPGEHRHSDSKSLSNSAPLISNIISTSEGVSDSVPVGASTTSKIIETANTLPTSSFNSGVTSQQHPVDTVSSNEMNLQNEDTVAVTDGLQETKFLSAPLQREPGKEDSSITDTSERSIVKDADHPVKVLAQQQTTTHIDVELESSTPDLRSNDKIPITMNHKRLASGAYYKQKITSQQNIEVKLRANEKDVLNNKLSLSADAPKGEAYNKKPEQKPDYGFNDLQISKSAVTDNTSIPQTNPKSENNPQTLPEVVTTTTPILQSKKKINLESTRKIIVRNETSSDSVLNHTQQMVPAKPNEKPVQEKARVAVTPRIEHIPTPIPTQLLHSNPVSRNINRPTANTNVGKPIITPKAPEVRIGQVDVFIAAPQKTKAKSTSSSRLYGSLASRHYLRRL